MKHHHSISNSISGSLFSARLTPYRSLGRRGFLILMAFVSLVCFGIGAYFYAIGAWPVVGFMGLDALLIYGAFKLNYRAARAYEDIQVSRQEVSILQVSPRGRERLHKYNPFFTRFVIDRHDEIGITKMMLKSRQRKLSIGGFLNPSDKESFAEAFGLALAQARN